MRIVLSTIKLSICEMSSEQPRTDKGYRHRVLLSMAGDITSSQRHFVKDLLTLLPHGTGGKKRNIQRELSHEADRKDNEVDRCDKFMHFEGHLRGKSVMLHIADKSGPTAVLSVHNIKTVEELNVTGSFVRGARPILSFDQTFAQQPQHRVVKELLKQCFATPEYHPKSKSFMDHTIAFSRVGDLITMRVYQITDPTPGEAKKNKGPTMVEIGPRCVLRMERVLSGTFGGRLLYSG